MVGSEPQEATREDEGVFTTEIFDKHLELGVTDAMMRLHGEYFSGYPAEQIARLIELFVRGLNGLADAAILLLQRGILNEFDPVVKALRGIIMPMFSGKTMFTGKNPYGKFLFAPRISMYMGRLFFYPQNFIPRMYDILLEAAGGRGDANQGRLLFDEVLESLGCKEASIYARKSLIDNFETIAHPAMQFAQEPTKTVTKACIICKKFFPDSRREESMRKFSVHPCSLGADRCYNSIIVDLHHEAYRQYRREKIARRTRSQARFIDLAVDGRRHLLVVGYAGCGKSEAALDAIEAIVERYGIDSVLAVSHNKKVAEKLNGMTTNSVFNLGVCDYRTVYKYIHTRGSERVKAVEEFCRIYLPVGSVRWMRIRWAIYHFVDEIWQYTLEMFEFLDLVCQYVRESSLPFGGLIRVFIGDPTQGKPFIGNNIKKHFKSAKNRDFPEYQDALDYFFQSTTIANNGYTWFVYEQEANQRMERELADFNKAIRLSRGKEKELAYLTDNNNRVPTESDNYYRNTAAVVNYIAHLQADFEGFTDDDVINFLNCPVTFKELHRQWESKKKDTYKFKVDKVRSLREDFIREMVDKAHTFLRHGGIDALRVRPQTGAHIICTDRAQVDARAFLRNVISAGARSLLHSRVEDTVMLIDPKDPSQTGYRHPSPDLLLNCVDVKRELREESTGTLLEDMCVFANEHLILTSNSAGDYLSSGDAVMPVAIKYVDGEAIVEVKVLLDEGVNMPTRDIAKVECVEVAIDGDKLPDYCRCKGKLVIIKRKQYPLVPCDYVTTVKSTGLTLKGTIIGDVTRTIKEGDCHLMTSRGREGKDLYLTRIPQSVFEMNSVFFKCNNAPKTLIEHLESIGTLEINGTFHVHHSGLAIVNPPTAKRHFTRFCR
jgi:hypothetical protein